VDIAQLGLGIGRDISRGEATERELDALIERRSRKGEIDADEREELWKEYVRHHNARLEAEAEHARLVWAKHLRGVYAARKEEYERLVETLEGTDRKGT
jgi:hypothetical protein